MEQTTYTTTTYKSQTRAEVLCKCMALARAFALLHNSELIRSDMVLELKAFRDIVHHNRGTLGKPYFLAIRKQGTEGGSLPYVMQQCKELGAPVAVLKIEDEEGGTFTLTIKH